MHRAVQGAPRPRISDGVEVVSYPELTLRQLADDGLGGSSPASMSTCPNVRPPSAECATQEWPHDDR